MRLGCSRPLPRPNWCLGEVSLDQSQSPELEAPVGCQMSCKVCRCLFYQPSCQSVCPSIPPFIPPSFPPPIPLLLPTTLPLFHHPSLSVYPSLHPSIPPSILPCLPFFSPPSLPLSLLPSHHPSLSPSLPPSPTPIDNQRKTPAASRVHPMGAQRGLQQRRKAAGGLWLLFSTQLG